MIRHAGLDDNAKRMFGSGSFAHFKSDILTKLPFHFECKNQETIKIWQFYEQARQHRTVHKKPVVIFTGNYRPIMACLSADDFLDILKELQDYKETVSNYDKEYQKGQS